LLPPSELGLTYQDGDYYKKLNFGTNVTKPKPIFRYNYNTDNGDNNGNIYMHS
jgi:hypothetical protein